MRPGWVLCCGLIAACATNGQRVPLATTLTAVPVRAADADWVVLGELAEGKPMVIELFATWCEPCREQLAEVDTLARRHAGEMVVVAVDVAEEAETVARYIRRHGLSLPVYLDPELRFQDSLGIDSVPQILVVDRTGRIVFRGARLDGAARAAIEALASPIRSAAAR